MCGGKSFICGVGLQFLAYVFFLQDLTLNCQMISAIEYGISAVFILREIY